jgi:hypothetical protein
MILSAALILLIECDTGGHFPSLECPEVILEDCRKLFGEYFKA